MYIMSLLLMGICSWSHPTEMKGRLRARAECKVICGQLTTTWNSDEQATEQHLDSFWLFVRVNNLHNVLKK